MNLISCSHQSYLLKTVYQTCRCIGGGTMKLQSFQILFIACGFKKGVIDSV